MFTCVIYKKNIYILSSLLNFFYIFCSLNDLFCREKEDPKGPTQATVQVEEGSTRKGAKGSSSPEPWSQLAGSALPGTGRTGT